MRKRAALRNNLHMADSPVSVRRGPRGPAQPNPLPSRLFREGRPATDGPAGGNDADGIRAWPACRPASGFA